MSRDQDKLIRQLSLVSFLLSRPRTFTAREVQEAVEGYADMSDETFARRFHGDRADLAKIGIEVGVLSSGEAVESETAQLYYLQLDDFRLPGVEFTKAECRALCLALAALDGRFAYARPLRLALTAILRGRQDLVRAGLEQLPVAFAPDEDARAAGRQLSRLEDALSRGKTVCFAYPDSEGGQQDRVVDPYSLFLIQGHWYLVGRDHLRDAIRTFRVGRMIGSIRFPTEKPRDFTVPPDYDPEQYRARPPWLIGSVIGTATVSVTEDLAWWVTRLEPHVSRLGETEGLTTFSVPYADEFPLLSWLTGLGTCARLLAPVELRQRAKAAMDAVFRVHERPLRPEASAAEVAPQQGSGRRQNAGATDPIAPEHLARTMSLLAYLLDEDRPQPVTWKALETDLGLTRKDVEEDLDLINLVNFGGGTYALTAEATPEGVEVTREMMADVFSSPARLSPAMAKALLLALDFIGDTLPVEGLESLDPVRQKVSRLIGQDLSAAGVVIDELVKPDPAMVGVLNRAIRDQELVEIDYYTTSRRELSRRLIEPYLLFHSPDGWYVEAFCQKAQAQRTFKLERICAARSTDTPFSPRGGLDLERRRTGDIAPAASEAKWARVVFEPRWATYLQERGTQHVPRADGRLEARVPYLEEAWIVQEVVSFLGEAELESPASARAKISEAARSLTAVYEDPGTPGVSLGGEV